MLHVRVNDRWRRALYIIPHPSGRRYALMPIEGEPDTVLIAEVEKSPWRSDVRTPPPFAPHPHLAS